jgi:hypothetical protein
MIIHYNESTGEITGVTTFSINPNYKISNDPTIAIDGSDLKTLANKMVNIQTKELEDKA